VRRLSEFSRPRGRIDRPAHLGDLVGREAALRRVVADRLLVLGEVDADRPAVHDVGLDPLRARREVGQRAVRLAGRLGEPARVQLLHARDPSLDQELAHRNPPLAGSFPRAVARAQMADMPL
jgi:hypothetical protein